MERFEGNGAECMVRFIAAGCKGRIDRASFGLVMNDVLWRGNRFGNWEIDWLSIPCVYTMPSPVWRIVPQPEAYADCLADNKVQAQRAIEPGGWYDVELCGDLWKTRGMYRFRVREDR